MTNSTNVNEWGVWQTANSTATSFASKVATATAPTDGATGVRELSRTTGIVANNIMLMPFGTDAANETFKMRVIGWSKTESLYIPCILYEFTCTLGSATGVANHKPVNTDLFADTITLDSGNADVDATILSTADDTMCYAICDLKGFSLVEIIFNRNSSSASCNTLYRLV